MTQISDCESKSPIPTTKIIHHFRLNSISILGSIDEIVSLIVAWDRIFDCQYISASSINEKFIHQIAQLEVLNRTISLALKKGLLTNLEENIHKNLYKKYQLGCINLQKSFDYAYGEYKEHFVNFQKEKIKRNTIDYDYFKVRIKIYKESCKLLAVIENNISQHDMLKYYYNNRKIICTLKGEIATYLSLEYYINYVLVGFGKYKQIDQEIIKLKKNINATYDSIMGSDAVILIDPNINDVEFKQIHETILTIIDKTLKDYSKSTPCDCVSWLNSGIAKDLMPPGTILNLSSSKKELYNKGIGALITSTSLFYISGRYNIKVLINNNASMLDMLVLSIPHRNDTVLNSYFNSSDKKKMLMVSEISILSTS